MGAASTVSWGRYSQAETASFEPQVAGLTPDGVGSIPRPQSTVVQFPTVTAQVAETIGAAGAAGPAMLAAETRRPRYRGRLTAVAVLLAIIAGLLALPVAPPV